MDVVALEVLDGVGPFLADEVRDLGVATIVDEQPTELLVTVPRDDLPRLRDLRCAVAAYLVLRFDVSRPRSLLSPDRLRDIGDAWRAVRVGGGRFSSFRLSAAGSDSEDLVRLREALAVALEVPEDVDEGDVLVRLRRSRVERGWEVLLRLTPRPLSARAWRTERFAGGLNATIAAAVVRALRPTATDAFVDLMCGSGTLVLERLAAGPAARVVGVDIDPAALATTRVHLRNARHRGVHVELLEADATALDGGVGRFDALVANLPWGTLVGSHDENDVLYPALLRGAAAVGAPSARFGVLTHDVRRFESVLRAQERWALEQSWRFFQKGHHPRLYLLRLQ